MGFETFHDQFLGSPVGFRDQIEIAFQFKTDMPLEIVAKQRSRVLRDLNRAFEKIRHYGLRYLVKILDIVLEDKQVGFAGSGDANKTLIVIFNDPANLLIVAQFDAHQYFLVDQVFQVLDLLECLLWRTRAFAL
jgi:hypothetical protein